MIDEAHDEALDILQSNRSKLDELATMLVERETLERDEVEAFLSDIPKRAQRDQSVRGAGPRRLPAGDPDGRAAEHAGHDPAQAHRLGFAARWPWTAGRRSTATGP